MGKAVTNQLTYAWVEYGDPRDGAAFTDGLYSMGWKSALRGFPTQKDKFGVRYVDASHPMLPIRFRGSGLLICPNEKIDKHHYGTPNPYLDDPIFEEYRASHTTAQFDQAIQEQNKFISEWVFSPGIKRVSPSESHLTLGSDVTDFCDLVAISGHGCVGTVWGGGDGAKLAYALIKPPAPPSDRLKYVIVASCYNLNVSDMESFLPALRRDPPVHGIFGYRSSYPGDQMGEAFYRRFAANLKAGDGKSNTILKAWRDAHVGPHSKIWSAILHTSAAKSDTMAKWLAGKLDKPDHLGEVREYNEELYPDGKVYVPEPPKYRANFCMGDTKITEMNNGDPGVGLFPGDQGTICIESTTGDAFRQDEEFQVLFYYFRPDKDGMDLNKLMAVGDTPDGKVITGKNMNQEDQSAFVDGFRFSFGKPGLTKVNIPYTVLSNATALYPVDGQASGYFNLRVVAKERPADEHPLPDYHFYRQGAWLRPKKP